MTDKTPALPDQKEAAAGSCGTGFENAGRIAPYCASQHHDEASPRFLRKQALAARLSVSVRCLENWMTRRIIPFTKIGGVVLFDPAEVDAALKAFHCDGRSKPR
jgi:hypothetical protein